ncbi:hypothetical protein V8E51_001059 [Hyaloscypha variabilis]
MLNLLKLGKDKSSGSWFSLGYLSSTLFFICTFGEALVLVLSGTTSIDISSVFLIFCLVPSCPHTEIFPSKYFALKLELGNLSEQFVQLRLSTFAQTTGSDIQKAHSHTIKYNKNEINAVNSEAEGDIFRPDQDHTDIGYGYYQEALKIDPVERDMLTKKARWWMMLDSMTSPTLRIGGLCTSLDVTSGGFREEDLSVSGLMQEYEGWQ